MVMLGGPFQRGRVTCAVVPRALGKHIILEVYGCSFEKLNDLEGLRRVMVEAAKRAGCKVLGTFEHKFSPHGVTIVVAVAESHISIHTWPEFGYAAIDIFTCGDADCDLIRDMLLEFLRPAFWSELKLERGRFSVNGNSRLE